MLPNNFEIRTHKTEDAYVKLVYVLMKEFHQPFSEIQNMPIPLINKLMKELEKEYKERERRAKKR